MSQKVKVAITLAFAIVLTGLTGAVALKTEWGEEVARQVVENNVSDAMPGRFELEALRDIQLFSPFGVARATAEGIKVFGPSGATQLEVGELQAELTLSALLGSRIHIPTARVSGVMLPVDPETGHPKFEKTKPRREAFKRRRMSVELDTVEVVGVYMVAEGGKGEKLMLGRLHGEIGELKMARGFPGVQMKLRRLKGEVSQPRSIKLLDAHGDIDTSSTTVANLEFSAITSGAGITGTLAFVPSDESNPVRFDIQRVRDAGNLMQNPMQMLGGPGLGDNMMQNFMGGMRPGGSGGFGGRP